MPLRSIISRMITAPASLVRRSTRASITTLALKLGSKVAGVSPMGGSALVDIAAQMLESQTDLMQDPPHIAVCVNTMVKDQLLSSSQMAIAPGSRAGGSLPDPSAF